MPQSSDELMTDVILGLVNSHIFFNVFSSLMIDLAELEKEQKVDEVKALRLTSFLKTIKYGVSNCAMRTAEEDRGFRRVQGLCCLFKSSVSHVSSSLCPQWFMLEDVASGKLHLRLEWLSPLSTPEKLDEVRKLWFLRRVLLETSEHFSAKTKLSLTILVFLLPPSQALTSIRAVRGQANDGLSSALLVVFLDSARNLPVSLVQFPSMRLHRHFYTRVVNLKEY